MDLTASLDAGCSPEQLFEWVADLSRYPTWLEIVARARERDDTGDEGAADPVDGADPAWTVDLRGRIGPLARSKRLRMERTLHEVPRAVRFERRELDGRDHSPWVLEASVSETEKGAHLEMRLHYGGRFGGAVLERMLRDEVEQSRERLRQLVESG